MEEANWPDLKPLTPGEVLEGKYRVGAPLGGGAMGLVYEAHHTLLDKAVAIKVLRPELALIDDARERFEAEARAAAAIGHPNIAQVTDMGRTAAGAVFFVMDRLRGETLGERLEREQRIDPALAVSIATDVLSGLEAAHALGLVHRDLKPDNIFLARQPNGGEVAKVLDFGVAKALATVGRRSKGTRTGMTVGTPQYMAPEQAAGDADVDARADLYAMGVVLYHMLAGRPPFEGHDVVQVLTAVIQGQARPLDELCPDATPSLVAVVAAAMHRNRERRPKTAAELAQKLQRALMGSGAVTRASAITAAAVPPSDDAGFAALSKPVVHELAPMPIAPGPVLPNAPALPRFDDGPPLELARRSPPAAQDVADTGVLPAASAPRRSRKLIAWVLPLALVAAGAVLAVGKLRGPAAASEAVADRSLSAVVPGDDSVLVELDVSPRDSRVLIDGAPPASNPIRLRRGGAHTLDASAEGYAAGATAFTADRAKTVTLKLERAKRRR